MKEHPLAGPGVETWTAAFGSLGKLFGACYLIAGAALASVTTTDMHVGSPLKLHICTAAPAVCHPV
jgi:hypothetical protein